MENDKDFPILNGLLIVAEINSYKSKREGSINCYLICLLLTQGGKLLFLIRLIVDHYFYFFQLLKAIYILFCSPRRQEQDKPIFGEKFEIFKIYQNFGDS